jgi:hypothetical protein
MYIINLLLTNRCTMRHFVCKECKKKKQKNECFRVGTFVTNETLGLRIIRETFNKLKKTSGGFVYEVNSY